MDKAATGNVQFGKDFKDVFVKRRKVLLSYVIVGTIFGIIATLMGFIRLLMLSGYIPDFNIYFFEHPNLQIFGFLVLFVSGIASVLVPTFRGNTPITGNLDYVFLVIIIAFQVLITFSNLPTSFSFEFTLSAFVLLLLYSMRYLYLVWDGISKGSRKIDDGDSYMVLSALSLLLTTFLLIIDQVIGLQEFTYPLLYLVLLGFVGSVIMGVMIKTSPSSPSVGRKKLLDVSVAISFVAVIVDFIMPAFSITVDDFLAPWIFLFGAFPFALAQLILFIKTEKSGRSLTIISIFRKSTVNFTRFAAFLSYLWLISGLILGVLYSSDGLLYGIKIAFIHAISIGFIGSTIMGYAPLLLPGIISARSPRTEVFSLSLYLLNVGTLLMVIAFIVYAYGISIGVLFTLGGIFIIAGIIWYIADIHIYIFSKKKSDAVVFSDDW